MQRHIGATNCKEAHSNLDKVSVYNGEPLWPGGKTYVRLVERTDLGSIPRFLFGRLTVTLQTFRFIENVL